jgi:hypothetical protein
VLSTLNGEATNFDQGLPCCRAHHLEPAASHTAVFQIQNSNFKSDVIDQYNLQVEQQFGANVITIGSPSANHQRHQPTRIIFNLSDQLRGKPFLHIPFRT